MTQARGFTLIELMVVISIIGILAAVALPQYQHYITRGKVSEAMVMASTSVQDVTDYYVNNQSFPVNNKQAGSPEAKFLIGNYVQSVTIDDGAIHVTLGHKIGKSLDGKVLSLRPAIVDGSPSSPISWLCGYDVPVTGMSAVGANKTSVDNVFLPANCREKAS